MQALRAITTIHRALAPGKPADKSKGIAAVPPKTEEIKAGAKFIPQNADEARDLLSRGAARVLTKEEQESANGEPIVGAQPVAEKGKPGRKPKSAEAGASDKTAKTGAKASNDGRVEGDADDTSGVV